jgi:hypothetical protein
MGKTWRGAKDGSGHLTHLLAAVDHDAGVVLRQVAVGARINEIPLLLDPPRVRRHRHPPPTPCTANGVPPNTSSAAAAITRSP